VTPDELLLEGLLRARAVCFQKRRSAEIAGALRARIHAIDGELADIVESIQTVCLRSGIARPDGVPPIKPSRTTAFEVALRILGRYLKLLESRRAVLLAAARAGDVETATRMQAAVLDSEETIRKHCERAKLRLPPELTKP